MKKVILSIALLFLLASTAMAQLDRVEIKTDYSIGLSERLAVKNSSSMGVIASLRFKLGENLGISLNSGFQQYSFSQDSSLAQWDWRYWNYYYEFVQTTLTEDEYSAVLSPFQKMDVIPVFLTVDYSFTINETVTISPELGGGIMFFTRRFYVTEDWARDFESIDYRFAYSFRNIGPEKSGNPVFFTAGINCDYEFSEDYFLSAAVNYRHILNTGENLGYNLFPLENSISFNLGLGFGY
ncbi:MAG: hypothetical protein SCALA702_36080 [Melioribacteraceae bacterium]|nr:MAG: hypothetical protein SCALA702_36080 [Melioribacteraceae bacterium]